MNVEDMEQLYLWVDDIPLSRPKRNIARDFSDGVLMAEVVKHFFPKLVDVHNYPPAHAIRQKLYNWETLQRKVFSRLGFSIDPAIIEDIVHSTSGAIEALLFQFRAHISSEEFASHGVLPRGTRSPRRHTKATPRTARSSGSVKRGEVRKERAVDTVTDSDKDALIARQQEDIQILEMKVQKLEQLLRLKSERIDALSTRLQTLSGI